jgi:hypothetical protein
MPSYGQLAHYSYHVGQIVYLARLTNNGDWQSLTIPGEIQMNTTKQKWKPGKE